MINDLNLDKTSRLSQEDIDRLIDNQDNKSRKAGPKLATAADVENEIESSSDHLVSKREKKRESGSLPSDIELESGTQQTSDQVTSDYSTGLNGNQMIVIGMPGYQIKCLNKIQHGSSNATDEYGGI